MVVSSKIDPSKYSSGRRPLPAQRVVPSVGSRTLRAHKREAEAMPCAAARPAV